MYEKSDQNRLDVVIVTGLSGSGKSTAIHVLEDLGYYCIDNLPVVLIPRFLELCESSLETLSRVAFGVDIRERDFLAAFPSVLEELRRDGYSVQLVFLDASEDVLARRFNETRRPHPLGAEAGLLPGIQKERRQLEDLRELADRIVDTTELNVHQLRDELRGVFEGADSSTGLRVQLVSFGFKFGVPNNVDMVFDVRFLSNPFFVDELRDLTGVDEAVAAYVLDRDETRGFVERMERSAQVHAAAAQERRSELFDRRGRVYGRASPLGGGGRAACGGTAGRRSPCPGPAQGHPAVSKKAEEVARRTVAIVNRLGLHARAATLFVQRASKFASSVAVRKDGETVDGKSIIGLMMLAAARGTTIEIETRGRDACEALDALAELVAARFEEPQ